MNLSKKTTQELIEMMNEIEADPKNKAESGLYLYIPSARKKLDAIRLQIAHNIRLAKLARRETVNDAGYSGRTTNKQ